MASSVLQETTLIKGKYVEGRQAFTVHIGSKDRDWEEAVGLFLSLLSLSSVFLTSLWDNAVRVVKESFGLSHSLATIRGAIDWDTAKFLAQRDPSRDRIVKILSVIDFSSLELTDHTLPPPPPKA